MLDQKQILEYAVKGITAEISELEKAVRHGYDLVKKIENGEKVKTPKTEYEILDICRDKKANIEKLEQMKNELKWQLSELEEKEQ